MRLLVPVSRRLGSVGAALVCLHAPRDRFGGHAGADLDIGLLDTDARLDGEAARAAVLGRQEPLAIRFGKA